MITLFLMFVLAGALGWASLNMIEDILKQKDANNFRKEVGLDRKPVKPLRTFHRS